MTRNLEAAVSFKPSEIGTQLSNDGPFVTKTRDDTLIWPSSFESDLQDEKNDTNLFFVPQKLTKLVHGRFKQQFL